MTSMHVQIRLRPTRFGFLVAPNDMSALHQVFAVNTCLWGGKYNPIIPALKNRPLWWERHWRGGATARQIVNGYLDYFEPDVLVETRAGQAEGLGYNDDRVMSLDRLLAPRDTIRDIMMSEAAGLSVAPLYRHLYEREYQYAKRRPEKFVRVSGMTPALATLAACMFGAFPPAGIFHDLERWFDDAFAPDIISLGSLTVAEIMENNWRNPLHVGHDGLKVDFGGRVEPRVFVFDGSSPIDLLDYWNLRGGITPVLPVPVEFAAELSPLVRRFIEQNHRPLPNNQHGVMIRPVVMFGRSLPTEAIGALFDRHFRVEKEGANCTQDWYPPIWRTTSELMVNPTRPRVTATEASHYLPVEGDPPTLRFEALKPDFAPRFGGRARWANVVTMSDWLHSDAFATAYPEDYRDPSRPSFGGHHGRILPTTEGYVDLAQYALDHHYFRLEGNSAAITGWLEDRQIKTIVSGSGRATQQIIATLGGLRGVAALANAEIIELLEKMSRRPLTKSMEHHQFRNRIGQAAGKSIWNPGAVRTLIEKNAVELGLEVRCDKCTSWSWYALNDLAAELKCQLCLQHFGFPALNPTSSDHVRWAYRLIGPFAQPNYAHGGYAAALAIRFFGQVLTPGDRPGLTWSAGQELTFPGGAKVEADFTLWYRRPETYGHTSRTQLVFGEAKSFGRECFAGEDTERMRSLAMAFPGAALVFATMKESTDLSPEEIKGLSALALWGRQRGRRRERSRAPVIILTGTELFSDYSLSSTWKEASTRHAKLIEPAYVRPDNLRVLADLTQQLYLGLEPYHVTEDRKWQRQSKRSRIAQHTVAQGDG